MVVAIRWLWNIDIDCLELLWICELFILLMVVIWALWKYTVYIVVIGERLLILPFVSYL